jgi:hypothetical protein
MHINYLLLKERTKLRMENHLLELEVETLARQVGQMEGQQKEIENSRTYFITPLSLNERVDKFVRSDKLTLVQLHDHPPTQLLHE